MLTLGLLNELDAFEHAEEIQEVSSQASSEASLEGILKKVCNTHQTIKQEFTIETLFITINFIRIVPFVLSIQSTLSCNY